MSESSKLRPLPWLTALVLALLGSLQACDCGSTGVDTLRFACTQDGECVSGFVCRQGECRPADEELDGGIPDGGGTDGGPDGGMPDGGPLNKPTRLAFVSAPQTMMAGQCSGVVELETRAASGTPSPVSTQTRVGLAGAATAGFLFFSDAACTTATTEAVFSPGMSRALFYFKGRTGGTFSLSAMASGFSTATQSETILPVVRTGTCTLPAGGNSVTCPIVPSQLDRAKTLLLFQASSDDDSPSDVSVRCSLSALNTITCYRNDNGLDDPDIDILWQTAELASGLTVQHLQATCNNSPFIELPIQPVSSLQEAFLLVSSKQDGSSLADDDFYTASLYQQGENAYHVDLEFSVDCIPSWQASVQIVELEDANVTRGTTASMTGTELVVSNLPAVDPSSTALLFTYRTSGASTVEICDRVLRGEIASPTSITFSRGTGAPSCAGASIDAISWERIEFGARASAQHFQVTMSPNAQTVSVPITAVDRTRTLVFASGQMLSGQAGGEVSQSADALFGASLGWHTLTSPTNLAVGRGATGGAAKWFSTVLQIEP